MHTPRILVVDDLPSKRAYLADLTQCIRPSCEIIQAESAQQAFRIIDACGEDGFEGGVIDFDLGGGYDGGDVIGRIRDRNPFANVALATARNEASFEQEAKPIALAAGANEALSTQQEDFERRLSEVLSLAA
ncbi:MAG: hypothetical protein PHX87_06480 [Candidatus Peribacteraceae bacterium]|nr:hypothetical protein [Candidatus Peribacteraceae bacterium]MDD5743035.1 hypothetical protein [Candidatus Peribacteraceae bacterium]